MTLVHISSSLGGGGAQIMVLQLARQSNTTIKTVVVSVSKDNALEDKFKKQNIENHFLNVNSFLNSSILRGLKKLHFILKNQDDIIFHCHQFNSFLVAFLYKMLYFRSIPIIFTLHSSKVEAFGRRAILYMTKWARKYDVIFSQNVELDCLKNNVIIPNGIDFSDFRPNNNRQSSKESIFNFLYLGRLGVEKNPMHMIITAEYLLSQGINDFVINMVGDGEERQKLEAGIKSHKLEKHIKIHGFQSNVNNYINDAHCLVLPSHFEGLPVVLVEAAASLLPVISTPVGSVPDFIDDSNGFLSDLDSFGETMAYVMTNYEMALEKTKKLNADVKSVFAITNVYEQHLKLYKSVLKS